MVVQAMPNVMRRIQSFRAAGSRADGMALWTLAAVPVSAFSTMNSCSSVRQETEPLRLSLVLESELDGDGRSKEMTSTAISPIFGSQTQDPVSLITTSTSTLLE